MLNHSYSFIYGAYLSRKGVAPSPTPWCSSYRKGSLRVTLDYGRQLYLLMGPIALGFGPATGPTLKTALCHIRTLVGRRINTVHLWGTSGGVMVSKVD